MSSRYAYQFQGGSKARMTNIEGFVSVGTGGMVNTITASGTSWGLTKGVSGVPTGWQGGYSGVIGLYGAGVASVARTATGTYAVVLQDSFVRLDSCQVQYFSGSSGTSQGLAEYVVSDTVGLGNSNVSTQNTIVIQFANLVSGVDNDIPAGGGFYIDIRVRDTFSNPQ